MYVQAEKEEGKILFEDSQDYQAWVVDTSADYSSGSLNGDYFLDLAGLGNTENDKLVNSPEQLTTPDNEQNKKMQASMNESAQQPDDQPTTVASPDILLMAMNAAQVNPEGLSYGSKKYRVPPVKSPLPDRAVELMEVCISPLWKRKFCHD